MFIDACRNVEDRAKGGTITPQDYQGMIAFYSCRDKEKSLEVKSIERGAFTHILLQALEETKKQNRCLTVAELEAYLMSEVPKLSPNQHPLARVEPTYKSNFILFGEAQEENIKSLYNLALQKAFVENKKEEARELLLHANKAAKGSDLDIINALQRLPSSPQVTEPVIPPLPTKPEPKKPPGEGQIFEVVTLNASGQEVKRKKGQAQYFTENLGNDITLDLVAIPGGKFLMGTEDEEIERLCKKYDLDYFRSEKPQHEVTVQPLFMGKYPVTQAQWREIASREDLKVECDLQADPSNFKGDERPVEQVSWEDAVEFCARLSKQTGTEYRLPTEAEWEYACRAGTITPFHFGETITTDLANYKGNYTYASEPQGEYRRQTTTVGSFSPNAFGLYDMHGNVCEWCEDDWHDDYEDAPTDGSAWLSGQSIFKVIHGGS